MSKTLEEIKEKVATVIKDSDGKLDAEDIENCMADALEHFNKELPQSLATKYTPTGDETDFELPDEWDAMFSQIRGIEFPLDQNPPTYLDMTEDFKLIETEMRLIESGDSNSELDNWEINNVVLGFNTDDTRKMYVTLDEPNPGEYRVRIWKGSGKADNDLVAEGQRTGNGTITLSEKNKSRLSGSVDVTWSSGTTSIELSFSDVILRFYASPGNGNPFRLLWTKRIKELNDFGIAHIHNRYIGAFVQLCAHYCAKALAFHYANTSDPTLTADVVDYKTKSDYYNGLADKTLAEFEAVALESGKGQVAHAVRDLDIDFAWREEKLFHKRRYR